MNEISSVLIGVIDHDARSALYYLGRYIKQAEYFQEYGKDIFEDEERSAPSERVKRLTTDLISAIESREGMPASDLDDDSVIRILDEITDFEKELGPEIDSDELERAQEFIITMGTPPSGSNRD